MSLGKKILETSKYIGAIAVIATAALFFDNMSDTDRNNHNALMDTLSDVKDEIHVVKSDFDQYKKTTNTHRVHKAEQANRITKELQKLQRNQNAIINNSSEQKEILDAIKNQQLINGIVETEPTEPVETIKLNELTLK